MVAVLVCKNDGCFELEQTELARLQSWSEVKMDLAHALYCEEELFAVSSAREISLYRLPDGESIEELVGGESGDAGGDERAQIDAFLVPDSRWVLDIFSGPMRRMSDLTLQTDHAIRGMRRSSLTPIGR